MESSDTTWYYAYYKVTYNNIEVQIVSFCTYRWKYDIYIYTIALQTYTYVHIHIHIHVAHAPETFQKSQMEIIIFSSQPKTKWATKNLPRKKILSHSRLG